MAAIEASLAPASVAVIFFVILQGEDRISFFWCIKLRNVPQQTHVVGFGFLTAASYSSMRFCAWSSVFWTRLACSRETASFSFRKISRIRAFARLPAHHSRPRCKVFRRRQILQCLVKLRITRHSRSPSSMRIRSGALRLADFSQHVRVLNRDLVCPSAIIPGTHKKSQRHHGSLRHVQRKPRPPRSNGDPELLGSLLRICSPMAQCFGSDFGAKRCPLATGGKLNSRCSTLF